MLRRRYPPFDAARTSVRYLTSSAGSSSDAALPPRERGELVKMQRAAVVRTLGKFYGRDGENSERWGRTPYRCALSFPPSAQKEKERRCGARHSVRRATLRRYFGDI